MDEGDIKKLVKSVEEVLEKELGVKMPKYSVRIIDKENYVEDLVNKGVGKSLIDDIEQTMAELEVVATFRREYVNGSWNYEIIFFRKNRERAETECSIAHELSHCWHEENSERCKEVRKKLEKINHLEEEIDKILGIAKDTNEMEKELNEKLKKDLGEKCQKKVSFDWRIQLRECLTNELSYNTAIMRLAINGMEKEIPKLRKLKREWKKNLAHAQTLKENSGMVCEGWAEIVKERYAKLKGYYKEEPKTATKQKRVVCELENAIYEFKKHLVKKHYGPYKGGLELYRKIEKRGGWPAVVKAAKECKTDLQLKRMAYLRF